ncbi:MAG TPA: hypothetical protein VGN83_27450 [Falsiroseomonas sp.]|jgi:hypothetical protein|nr:hypothetical protein [Falsiroseomonas sp.]
MRSGHQRAHLLAWLLMALALPAILFGAAWLRAGMPGEDAPRRLSPPPGAAG